MPFKPKRDELGREGVLDDEGSYKPVGAFQFQRFGAATRCAIFSAGRQKVHASRVRYPHSAVTRDF